jgi:hypothetical protein
LGLLVKVIQPGCNCPGDHGLFFIRDSLQDAPDILGVGIQSDASRRDRVHAAASGKLIRRLEVQSRLLIGADVTRV